MGITFDNIQGKINLQENEIVICTEYGSVKFELNNESEIAKAISSPNEVIIRLTNLRIILCNINESACAHFRIQNIKEFVDHKPSLLSFFKKDKRITISLESNSVEITFNEDKTYFINQFKAQIEKKSWSKLETKPVEKPTHSFSTQNAGLSGLMNYESKKKKEVDESLQTAFKDLDSLFKEAENMISIANKLTQIVNSENLDKDDESYKLHTEIMDKMGIWSPVTRTTHRNESLYLKELSKELCDFIIHKVFVGNSRIQFFIDNRKINDKLEDDFKINLSMISLADIYCIFNRARGTELISPEDLLDACKLFKDLNLPLKLVELESGFLMITTIDLDEKSVTKKIYKLLTREGRMTSAQLSQLQNIALPMALHYLYKSEELGLLCRDESSEGLVFYPNLFFTEEEREAILAK